jgi:hypothetical protein
MYLDLTILYKRPGYKHGRTGQTNSTSKYGIQTEIKDDGDDNT